MRLGFPERRLLTVSVREDVKGSRVFGSSFQTNADIVFDENSDTAGTLAFTLTTATPPQRVSNSLAVHLEALGAPVNWKAAATVRTILSANREGAYATRISDGARRHSCAFIDVRLHPS